MQVITLIKFRRKPTKADLVKLQKMGTAYFTLGRYDAILISKSPNEKIVLREAMNHIETAITESMVSVPLSDVIRITSTPAKKKKARKRRR